MMDIAVPSRHAIKTAKRILGAFRQYFWLDNWRSRGIIFLTFLTILAGKGFNLIAPFFYKEAVDALSPSNMRLTAIPLVFVLAYGGARLAEQLSSYTRNVIFEAFLAQRADQIRCGFFEHLHRLSVRFHLERQTGGLSLSLLRGVNAMRTVFENIFFNMLPVIIEVILLCVTLTKLYDIKYLALMLVATAIYLAATYQVTGKRSALLRDVNMAYDRASTQAVDSLLNFETVKYFAKEEHEVGRFRANHEALRVMSLKSTRGYQSLFLIQGAVIAVTSTLAMIMAAHDVSAGHMKVGDFVLINTYLLQLFGPLGGLGGIFIGTRAALVDMEAMLAVLDHVPEVADLSYAKTLNVTAGDVIFDNVRFGYDHDREILKGISFHIPAGKRVAIVGATGAGKSTISKLLFRLYDPWSGVICIDGQDIRQVCQSSLRAAIEVVPQDTVLFNDTISYNISYGSQTRGKLPHSEIVHAAKLACLHHFISQLPQGYETRVGERGLKLSGGEKQRVAIARAILKRPHILLLDEATSSLDNNTEAEIQSCLRGVAAHCTTLVIAHRLSTIVDADEIIVLDAGEIVERGKHESLLIKGGRYARMWHGERLEQPLASEV